MLQGEKPTLAGRFFRSERTGQRRETQLVALLQKTDEDHDAAIRGLGCL